MLSNYSILIEIKRFEYRYNYISVWYLYSDDMVIYYNILFSLIFIRLSNATFFLVILYQNRNFSIYTELYIGAK